MRLRRRGSVRIGVIVGVAGWLVVGAAAAQSADDALRRDLVEQAERARESGDHARSLDLATRAGQLRMTPSLALMLAQENEQLGHIVDALDRARQCASDALRDPNLHHRDRLARICRDAATALAQRVARVVVHVPAADGTATVLVGGRTIPPAGWDVPIPVDPGDVVVRASTADGRRFERTVPVAAGASADVTVALRVVPTESAVPTVAAVTTVATPTPLPAPAEPTSRRRVGAGPWVVGASGAALLVTAGVLWAVHGSAISARDGECSVAGCHPAALDFDQTARNLTLGTNVTLGLGGAAMTAGVIWYVVARTRRTESIAMRPTAWVVPTLQGVAVGGVL